MLHMSDFSRRPVGEEMEFGLSPAWQSWAEGIPASSTETHHLQLARFISYLRTFKLTISALVGEKETSLGKSVQCTGPTKHH